MKNEENFIEEQDTFSEDEGLSAEDFANGDGNFISNPAVGESIEFVLSGVKKQPKKKVKNPKTGRTMDITLSSVDYYYDFITPEDKVYSATAWQVVGKTKAILKKLGKYGVKLKIEHIADGRETTEGEEAWKVYAEVDGEFKQLDKDSNEWK